MNIVNIGCNNGDDHVLAFCKKHRDKLDKVLMVNLIQIDLMNVLRIIVLTMYIL